MSLPGPARRSASGVRPLLRDVEGRGGLVLVTPEAVARTIVQATAARPNARSMVGWSARAIFATRKILPDRAWDVAMRRAPGGLGWAQAGVERVGVPDTAAG